MKIIIPQNLYAAIFALVLPENIKSGLEVLASSLISKEIKQSDDAIGLIPTCDIITHQDFYISKKFAISFDDILSNSFIYFNQEGNPLSEILLQGDISSNEAILTKILFKEKYDTDTNVVLDVNTEREEEKNYVIVGNENFDLRNFNKGFSFSDQVADLIDFPYVNFVFASESKEALEKFNSSLENLDDKVEDKIDEILDKINYEEEIKKFIKMNLNSVYFDLTDNEIEGIKELIKLTYYHNIVDDMFDIKFV
ncbi:MAG: hypothetical protein PVH88_04740 [Ignavibacteria bacterium]|jgi:predicted solute-binding protein